MAEVAESVSLSPVPVKERLVFDRYFQEYLKELSLFNGMRPNRWGLFDYGWMDEYWRNSRFMPFYIMQDGDRVGLLLLRELRAEESPDGKISLQVAEITIFPPHRQGGIGRAAMELALKMADARGASLSWSAYVNNTPANCLYKNILADCQASGRWNTSRTYGIDNSGLARYYYFIKAVDKS